MNYLPEILTFLLWPVVIVISYYLCVYAIKRFERKHRQEHS